MKEFKIIRYQGCRWPITFAIPGKMHDKFNRIAIRNKTSRAVLAQSCVEYCMKNGIIK